MIYINMKNSFDNNNIETVDEFETRKEAKKMLLEYRISDNHNYYYLSQRSTNEWKE